MTDIPDWAQDKAREWLENGLAYADYEGIDLRESTASLAALLMDVDAKAGLDVYCEARAEAKRQALAEVRRVVEDTRERATSSNRVRTCDEILSRLDKL